jgi:hypothetical protein
MADEKDEKPGTGKDKAGKDSGAGKSTQPEDSGKIDTQEKAEKEAKKYKCPPHVALVYVTEDANVFYDYDHSAANAHATQNKLQIFTVRKK